MMIVFWIIIGLDALLIVLNLVASIESAIKNKFFSKLRPFKKSSNDQSMMPNTVLGKSVFIILSFIAIVLILAFSLAIIWVPIVVSISVGWRWSLVSFMLIYSALSLLLILIFNRFAPSHQNKEGAVIKEAISISFFALMSVFVLYGKVFPLENLIETVFSSSLNFTFTITIFIPVLVISLLITNVYLFVNGLKYLMDKSKKIIRARAKIIDILTIFTISSFFSLFFLVDREWSFLNVDNSTRFYQTLDVFKNILVAVLVPLILAKFVRKDESRVINNPNNGNQEGIIVNDDSDKNNPAESE